MNKQKIKIIAAVCSGVLLTGCATMEQSAGLAALGCGGLGAIIGVATGSTGAGVGAGAGCMALAAIGIYNYHSSQTRTVQQDQQIYGYAPLSPGSSAEVKIRNATASPEKVRSGDTLKIAMDYSVMAPKGTQDVNVKESLVLKRDGEVLKTLDERLVKRPLGGGSSEVDFTIPAKLAPGTYVIEQKVTAGTSYDVRPVVFVVGA